MNEFFANIINVVQHTFTFSGVLWIAITLVMYAIALLVHRLGGSSPLLHPLLLTASAVGVIVWLSNTELTEYRASAGLIHWLLGPATVALALPMYGQWQRIKHLGWRLVVAIAVGGVVAPILAWSALWLADAPLAIQMTMLSKSITTPLAMEATRLIGGVPALAAVFVIITGIIGAIFAAAVFRVFGVTDPQAAGLALGSVCHAVGTAKALHMSDETGAMATLGLCLNGIMTALVLPLLFA